MVERLSGAVLEITASIAGTDRTGIFELRKDFEPEPELTRRFVVGPVGEIGARLLNIPTNEGGKRRPYTIDAGGGKLAYTFRVSLSETPHNSSYLQMGDTGDETQLTVGDATGQSARDQLDVFLEYATEATTDSVSPATLHIGHHHDGTYSESGDPGLYESPRTVYIPETRVVGSSEEPSSVDLSVTCVLAGSLDEATDAAQQLG
ncbi:hypothetical protein [Halobellus rubicundus]|uniref:Uncharacterized protein n=1 Tax=Halobellus rubicundus TaxID=2996466 RepID=A0ABD5MDV6_9EURY